jgi:hypothetical protein
LAAGLTPEQFWRSTIGEIFLAISAANERRRQNIADQVVAITRALGAAFGEGQSDPLEGLTDKPERTVISMDQVRLLRFWRKPA